MCVCTETRPREADIDCTTTSDVNCPYSHQLEPATDDFTHATIQPILKLVTSKLDN